MVQRGEHFGLAPEPGQPVGVGRHQVRQHLEGHLALQARVGRPVDLALAALADLRGDFVDAEAGRTGIGRGRYIVSRSRRQDVAALRFAAHDDSSLCQDTCQANIRPEDVGWMVGQGRITLTLSPPDPAHVAYRLAYRHRPCHLRGTGASRFEAFDVTSACLFRLTPDELVYALRRAISARWPGRNEHGRRSHGEWIVRGPERRHQPRDW